MRARLESPYRGTGAWRKACLHCHSTNSDGNLPPAEVARFYRERGYSILSVTDHRRVTRMSEHGGPEMLFLDGIELSSPHMVGVGLLSEMQDDYGLQSQIDAIEAHGGVVIVVHPAWTGLHVDEIAALSGYVGIEIWNVGTERENGKGSSINCWDELLDRGHRVWGFASDDAHRYADVGAKAWVMVRTDRLTRVAVLQALRNGDYYSSTGPVIEEVCVEERVDEMPTVRVRCSPCREVVFVGTANYGQVFRANDTDIVEACHQLQPWDWVKYLRIECRAADRTRGWTNPIFVSWEP